MPEEAAMPQASMVAILTEANRGKTMLEVDAGLQQVLESVKAHGGKGSLTVKLSIAFMQQLDHEAAQVAIDIECKSTLPKVRRVPAVFFVDEKCAVTREDPNQLKLDLERIQQTENVRPMPRKEA